MIYDYEVTAILRVVDGDTFDLTVARKQDFGFYQYEEKSWSTRFRLVRQYGTGVDTPETNEAGGAAATEWARDWLATALEAGVLRGQTYKADDFGRWLIDLYRTDTAEHLGDALIAAGHAEVWVRK